MGSGGSRRTCRSLKLRQGVAVLLGVGQPYQADMLHGCQWAPEAMALRRWPHCEPQQSSCCRWVAFSQSVAGADGNDKHHGIADNGHAEEPTNQEKDFELGLRTPWTQTSRKVVSHYLVEQLNYV